MSRDLTLKQREFVKEYVQTKGNGVKAAQRAYDTQTYTTAGSIATENLQKPKVKTAILEALEDAGITSQFLAKKHKKAIGWIDHEEAPRAALGVKALKLAYDVRGELTQQLQAQGSVEVTVAVQVLNELTQTAVEDAIPVLTEAERDDKPAE